MSPETGRRSRPPQPARRGRAAAEVVLLACGLGAGPAVGQPPPARELPVQELPVQELPVQDGPVQAPPAPVLPSLEGWRDFRFGTLRAAAMALLGDGGEVYAGAVRAVVEDGGVSYDLMLKFPEGRLREIYLRSSLARAKPAPEQACWATHAGLVRDAEAEHGVKGETEVTSVGTGVRYIFSRTRLSFAEGARLVIESKFVPTLSGGGLCESTRLYQDRPPKPAGRVGK